MTKSYTCSALPAAVPPCTVYFCQLPISCVNFPTYSTSVQYTVHYSKFPVIREGHVSPTFRPSFFLKTTRNDQRRHTLRSLGELSSGSLSLYAHVARIATWAPTRRRLHIRRLKGSKVYDRPASGNSGFQRLSSKVVHKWFMLALDRFMDQDVCLMVLGL